MKLYRMISQLLVAAKDCEVDQNLEWKDRHIGRAMRLAKEHLAHGSGFDAGTSLNPASTPNCLVFTTSFHHMNEDGYYTHWTDHTITVTPNLAFGFDLLVSGEDHDHILDYISDIFNEDLCKEVEL